MKMRIAVLSMFAVLICASTSAQDRKFIVKSRASGLNALPFSDAVVVGNTLYIAGHIGLDSKGQPPASAEDEARMVMDSVKQTVEQAGFTMEDIVSVQIFCTDLKLYDTFNSVYKTYFHGDFPARAFIGTNNLVRNGRFEVMGIAIKRAK
ncbi:MAG TPA: Rid family hydrolase [Candidatus Sulfotelmatobacter sp.]|nr:Rid family hydrolase [Candidatus Sulfotelmatobacter sp.]